MSDFKALIVDDEKTYATALARALKRRGVQCEIALDAETALSKARSSGPYQVVLLDNRLPDDLGLRIIARLRAIMPGTTILMMTAYESIEDAVEAMRLGAGDYVAKSTHTEPIVARVLESRERLLARTVYDSTVPADREESLMGVSGVMRRLRQNLDEIRCAEDTPVLLLGETGTGRASAARYIHRSSASSSGAFVTLACAAGPAGPADSTIFGRIRHTVSGGEVVEDGILDAAANGVLYLDGIDEAPDRLQKMILAVLTSGSFRRVGSSEEIALKTRVVASAGKLPTDSDLHERLVAQLNVFPISMPPLREREDDIIEVANYCIEQFGKRMGKSVQPLDAQVAELLRGYDFPGNVRELRNIIERAMIIVRGNRIYPEHLPERVLHQGSDRSSSPPSETTEGGAKITVTGGDGHDEGSGLGIEFVPGVDTIDSVEKRLIVQALQMSGGVKSRAAKLLGISRFQLLRRLEKYGLETKKK